MIKRGNKMVAAPCSNHFMTDNISKFTLKKLEIKEKA